jgi:preprotein translocase subunit SecG
MAENTNPSVNQPNKNQGSPINPNHNNRGNNSANNKLKTITIVLAIALFACLGVLYYVWNEKSNVVAEKEDISAEKDKITLDLLTLKDEYNDLRTNNDTINAQLTRERQKIDLLLNKIKSIDASNRNNLEKIKEYERELGSLRSVLRGYVGTIDSLDNLTQKLRAENTEIKQQATESKKKYDELSQKTDNLQTMVEKGSVVKARDVIAMAVNDKNKEVGNKASKTKQIRTCFTLTSNSIAQKGIRSLYVRIKDSSGSLLTKSPDNIFSLDDSSQLIYSAMREVDFQGEDLEVCIFYSNSEDFMKGVYNIEVYMGGTLIGTGQMLLK